MRDHDGDITPGTKSYYGDWPDLRPQPKPAPQQWGLHGTRYDEECDRCRRETEIDNDTGLCQRCSR